jgi:hypothetical protein
MTVLAFPRDSVNFIVNWWYTTEYGIPLYPGYTEDTVRGEVWWDLSH